MSNGILVVKTKNQCELCSTSVPAQRPNARSKSKIWGAGPTPRPHHPPAHARPHPKSRKRTKPHRLQRVTPVPHRRHPVPSTPRPWRQPSHFSRILVSSSAAWARWGSRTRVEGILVKKVAPVSRARRSLGPATPTDAGWSRDRGQRDLRGLVGPDIFTWSTRWHHRCGLVVGRFCLRGIYEAMTQKNRESRWNIKKWTYK